MYRNNVAYEITHLNRGIMTTRTAEAIHRIIAILIVVLGMVIIVWDSNK